MSSSGTKLSEDSLHRDKLAEVLEGYGEIAVAFSGGVDSSYLLYAAGKYCRRTAAYIVRSAFQPDFEFEDAKAFIDLLGEYGNGSVELRILDADVLAVDEVVENPENRCYYCKKAIFGKIINAAAADGFAVVADGTNSSDEYDDRPGMKALAELGVVSLLRQAGLTKDMIRQLSQEAGLPTASKPSYACLATRVQHGTRIEKWMLDRTEEAEKYLMGFGLRDFRVRLRRAESAAAVAESAEAAANAKEPAEKWFAGLEMAPAELEMYRQNKAAIDAKLLSLYDGIMPEIKIR